MAKKFKNDMDKPMTPEEMVERLEDVAETLDNAADKLDGLCTPTSGSNTTAGLVTLDLDERTKNALVESCGKAARKEIKDLLEARQERFKKEAEEEKKRNKEQGIRTPEEALDVVSKMYEDVGKQVVYNSEWMKKFNSNNCKARSWQINELRAVRRHADRQVADVKAHIDGLVDKILNKSHIPKPKLLKEAGFWHLQRHYFVRMPCYWLRCFFFDRHTKNYFRIIVVCCWVVVLSLMGFMANNEAKLEREAEKYRIIRLWSYVNDGTDPVNRVRQLDALFEDEANNRKEINALIVKIRDKYVKQQQEQQKRAK